MEIIPKETPKIPPWLDVLFYLSAGLLIFVFISFFLISQSIKSSEKLSASLDEQINDENSKSAELKNEILVYQKKIQDFSSVINGHVDNLNLFSFIQKQCHPRVWFRNFSLDARGASVRVSGEAEGFQELGQQIIIFRDEPMIKSVNLGSVSMEKGGKVSFDLSLSFDPSIFIFK